VDIYVAPLRAKAKRWILFPFLFPFLYLFTGSIFAYKRIFSKTSGNALRKLVRHLWSLEIGQGSVEMAEVESN
jgi:hypothetical protein